MGRTKSVPTFEWLSRPVEGKEKQVDQCKKLVEWCMDDTGKTVDTPRTQPDYKVSERHSELARPQKLMMAIKYLESDMPDNSLEKIWASNELRQRGFDPNETDQRKLVFLVANGCHRTNTLLQSLQRDESRKNEKVEGLAFGQAWKDLIESSIAELGFTKSESYKMFDAVFDNPKILRLLGERRRLGYVNGIEAELAAYWHIKENGQGDVRFGSESEDRDNKSDLVITDNMGKRTFVQVKVRQGRHDLPMEYDVFDSNSLAECQRIFERSHDNVDEIRRFRSSIGVFTGFARSMAEAVGSDRVGATIMFMPIRLEKVVERSRQVAINENRQPRVDNRAPNAISLNYAE